MSEDDSQGIWEQEPVDIAARPSGKSVFTMRWDTAEFHDMLHDARQAGMSASAYVRECVQQRRHAPRLPQVGLIIATGEVTFAHVPTWSEAPHSEVSYERR